MPKIPPASAVAPHSRREWCEPAQVFRVLERESADLFWLDAGATAKEGRSYLGTGRRDLRGPGEIPTGGAGADGVFRGGWVGWIDYESGATAAGAPAAADGDGPAWLRVRDLLIFDHETREILVTARDEEARGRLDALLEAARASEPFAAVAAPPDGRPAAARHVPAAYEGLVEACREDIRLGNAYQLCLTTRFTVSAPPDAAESYLRLRAAQPSHHGGFLRIGGRALLSASPERFIGVGEGVLRTEPIKGTRPRGLDAEGDDAFVRELRESEKERAENVMIVDLMRNDIGRVCEPGSVRVPSLLRVESYAEVHQLVSTVEGRLRRGTTVDGLLSAVFPAGSMTGAPKLSAMTILHAREGAPRGIYSGCFGWIGDDGALDLAMVIRSIVHDGGTASVGAGGGITWGSDARAEVAEVALKARGPLAALGAVLPPEWASLVG